MFAYVSPYLIEQTFFLNVLSSRDEKFVPLGAMQTCAHVVSYLHYHTEIVIRSGCSITVVAIIAYRNNSMDVLVTLSTY